MDDEGGEESGVILSGRQGGQSGEQQRRAEPGEETIASVQNSQK